LAEDLEDASFAGQLDSFLYVSKEDILEKLYNAGHLTGMIMPSNTDTTLQ
jgi:hypothetical protein